MAARRIFSMRILYFEKDGARMVLPARYPRDALACLSTHDIAPLEAWWEGDEIALRKSLGRIDRAIAAAEHRERRADKRAILALAGLPPRRAEGPLDDGLVVAIHRLVARTASRLVAVRLEDVLGQRRLVNLPGTDREHPNWRNTLPVDVDGIVRSRRLDAVLNAVRQERETP
jgi:4-alpha-glucanotransferase